MSNFLLTPFTGICYTNPCVARRFDLVTAPFPVREETSSKAARGGWKFDRRCHKDGNQAYLSAQEAPWTEGSRLPQADGHGRRPQGPLPPPRQRPDSSFLLRKSLFWFRRNVPVAAQTREKSMQGRWELREIPPSLRQFVLIFWTGRSSGRRGKAL